MRGNAQLLGENLTVSACLVEHIHEVGVFKDVLHLAAAQKVFDVLGDTCRNTAPFAESLPDFHRISGGLLLLQKQVHVTHSGEGEGLLFYGSTILPFVDHFPKNTELYRIMTTKPQELKKEDE